MRWAGYANDIAVCNLFTLNFLLYPIFSQVLRMRVCEYVCVSMSLYLSLFKPNQRVCVCVLTMSARGSLNQLIRLLLYLCPATRYTTLLNTRVEKFIALLACRSYHQKYLLPRVIRQFQLISIKNTKTKKMEHGHCTQVFTHTLNIYVCMYI